MFDQVRMETDEAVVDVLPPLGGAIAAFALKRNDDRVPILRPWAGDLSEPRSVGCSPMVPWFNRISGGGFSFDGAFYPIAPTDPREAFPLHGDGWCVPWEVVDQAPQRIALRLRSRNIPPFDYEATQVLTLAGPALEIGLSVKHCGDMPIPYGLGLHPWLPRTPGVTLEAHATGVWLEQPPDFPQRQEPQPIPAEWDFSNARSLPDNFIDNGFAGWGGGARIEWTDRGVALDIKSDRDARYYHVYSPDKTSDVFCFEPVTHANNAFAKPGGPAANDLRVLQPGEETSMSARFTGQLL